MRPYEVMVIFDADLEEEAVRSAVERATQLLQSRGAGSASSTSETSAAAVPARHRWESSTWSSRPSRARDGRLQPDPFPG